MRTADFRAFHAGVLDPGIRIFGPDATVAQDLEPEFIAVSRDSATAYVTLQENNAIAVVDIRSAEVTKLMGLGWKDHGRVEAATETHEFRSFSLPPIGKTPAGQPLFLGGFSGLHFEGTDPRSGALTFITHTDRGPNAEPTGILRPFLLPGFTPQLVRFELNPRHGKIEITQIVPLQQAPGLPLTGLPNTSLGSSGNAPYNDEVPVDLLGNPLPLDPLGADLEGIVTDPRDGTFWMVDEYRPAIYHFDSAGVLLSPLVPAGTAAAAGMPPGTYGAEVLPSVLAQRRQNRGFEGIAYDDGKVYAFMQSPLRNPPTLANSVLNNMQNIRVVELDTDTLATRQFVYVMDNPNLGGSPNTRADKIGDAVSLGNGEFLILERDDDALPDDDPAWIEKKIYRFNLAGATDVSGFTGAVGATGKTVDQLSLAEMTANGIQPIAKRLHVDLNQAGYNRVQKVEGLAVIDPWTLAVINDNDFGVADITVHPDGSFTLNYQPETEQLGIIEVRSNGLDASDRDGRINISQWPVHGLYLPDGIASYKSGSRTYLVTANEGDAREYDTFEEAVRVGSSSVVLDPAAFPDAAVLKNNANLGRLNI
ncbi:MAG: esterase-like activity of phytase family protein, partial [Acidobacteria bacterium]|nr:esterase-like activity of phytase family protein [Acidobacteriota bacterium]